MTLVEITCAAWIKDRGHGVYGSHPCRRPATADGYCPRHSAANKRADAKLAAYAGRHKQREQKQCEHCRRFIAVSASGKFTPHSLGLRRNRGNRECLGSGALTTQ